MMNDRTENNMDIDYDQLNEEAAIIYDVGFGKGREVGRRNTASESAELNLRARLDLAVVMLQQSVSARDQFEQESTPQRRGSDWPERVFAQNAQRLLERVMRTPDVAAILAIINNGQLYNDHQPVKRDVIDRALKHAQDYLASLGGYR